MTMNRMRQGHCKIRRKSGLPAPPFYSTCFPGFLEPPRSRSSSPRTGPRSNNHAPGKYACLPLTIKQLSSTFDNSLLHDCTLSYLAARTQPQDDYLRTRFDVPAYFCTFMPAISDLAGYTWISRVGPKNQLSITSCFRELPEAPMHWNGPGA